MQRRGPARKEDKRSSVVCRWSQNCLVEMQVDLPSSRGGSEQRAF